MTDATSPQPRIPEFGGGVRLNRLASEWAAEIGHDRDRLAGAILEAYAGGEFDSVQGNEVILGFDDENLRTFSIGKNRAKGMAAAAMKPLADGNTSWDYLTLVRRGFVYVRPEAIVLFAKRRELAQPTWFESQKATHPGGAPERYEWALIENLLEKECELQGSVPHSGHNDPEWRSKTHAIKYVREKMSRDWRDDGPADSTLRDRVSQMLDRITERMKKAEN
jgi:hypothetical protein